MDVEQEFQKVSISMNSGNRKLHVNDPVLTGERICFSAVNPDNGNRYIFSGRVNGSSITGMAQIRTGNSRTIENWSATLDSR